MNLVTGGTGLVGGHLLYHLLKKGEKVRAIMRKSSNLDKTRYIFKFYGNEALLLFDKIEWVNADLLNYESMKHAMEGINIVYHAGAMVSFNPKQEDLMKQVNEEGTANLVNLCIECRVKKLCFVSSIATLGDSKDDEMLNEESYWKDGKNSSTYSITKFRAEMEVWRGASEGLNVAIINPSVIIGAGDWTQSSGKLISTVHKGLKFYTSGGVGYVDVRDVVRALITLAYSDVSNKRYVLNGANLSYKDFFTKVAHSLHIPAPQWLASKLMLGIAWRLDKLKSIILCNEPTLTQSTARTACKTSCYSGELITKELNFEYTNIDDTINDVAEYYLRTL